MQGELLRASTVFANAVTPSIARRIQMSDPVKRAAIWLATTPNAAKPRPVIPYLREQFGLTAVEAVQAITESNLIRARAQ